MRWRSTSRSDSYALAITTRCSGPLPGCTSSCARLLTVPDCGGESRQPGPEVRRCRPAEPEPEVVVVELEPVPRPDVGPVLPQQDVVEGRRVDPKAGVEANETDTTAGRFDPVERVVRRDPVAHDAQASADVVDDRRQESFAISEDVARDGFIDGRPADDDLLLGGQQRGRDVEVA